MKVRPASRLCIVLLTIVALSAPRAAIAEDSQDYLGLLYMQTSAEYRALCTLVYRTATHAIDERIRLANFPRSAQGRRVLVQGTQQLPLAVVMDMDETVVDNSGFEVQMVRMGKAFDAPTWQKWLRFQATDPRGKRMVPGALDFIRAVEAQGVSVIYLSNRDERDGGREAALGLLRGLGVSTERLEERLLLLGTKEEERQKSLALLSRLGLKEDSEVGRALLDNQSAKHRRRVEVMLSHHVVGWFGDDFNDFPVYIPARTPQGRPMIEVRRRAVDEGAAHWGTDWFVLPNPVYGSWERGRTLPKDPMPLLDDFGFGEYLKR